MKLLTKIMEKTYVSPTSEPNEYCPNTSQKSIRDLSEKKYYLSFVLFSDKHSYNLNETAKSKKCSGCATKICIFFTGFIIGLILSLLILSALQTSSNNNKSTNKRHLSENKRNESLISPQEISKSSSKRNQSKKQLTPNGRSMKDFAHNNNNNNNNESDLNAANTVVEITNSYNNNDRLEKTGLNATNTNTNTTTTFSTDIIDSYPTQGHNQLTENSHDIDDNSTYIETLFPYIINHTTSIIDNIEPIEAQTEKLAGNDFGVRFDDNRNASDDNYNEINKPLTNKFRESKNVFTTTFAKTIVPSPSPSSLSSLSSTTSSSTTTTTTTTTATPTTILPSITVSNASETNDNNKEGNTFQFTVVSPEFFINEIKRKQINSNKLTTTTTTENPETTTTPTTTTATTRAKTTTTITTTTPTTAEITAEIFTTPPATSETVLPVINESNYDAEIITTTENAIEVTNVTETVINYETIATTIADVVETQTPSLNTSDLTPTITSLLNESIELQFSFNQTELPFVFSANRSDRALVLNVSANNDSLSNNIEISLNTTSANFSSSHVEHTSNNTITHRPDDPYIKPEYDESSDNFTLDSNIDNNSANITDAVIESTTTESIFAGVGETSPSLIVADKVNASTLSFLTPTPAIVTTIETIPLTDLSNNPIHGKLSESDFNSSIHSETFSNNNETQANSSNNSRIETNLSLENNNNNNTNITEKAVNISGDSIDNTTDTAMIYANTTNAANNFNSSTSSGDFNYLNSSLTSVGLNDTNITVWQSDNSTESMLSALNISSSITPEVYCLSTQFSCPNQSHRCLDNDLICDGIIDCPIDSYDELDCNITNCGTNFMCNNSIDANSTANVKCISKQSYCDGIWDCDDGSDELGCHLQQCRKGEFLCRDGSACIKGRQACDFNYNCPDHSDEIGCVSRTGCLSMGRFYCDDGLCIERSLRCDGIPDCHNGTDELNCTCQTDEYQCADYECVNKTLRCNGRNDCDDGSDEYECMRSDSKGVIQVYDPLSDQWSVLCAKSDFESADADHVCHSFGYSRATNYTLLSVIPQNTTWVIGLPQNQQMLPPLHSPVCDTNLTASIFCEQFECGQNVRIGQDSDNAGNQTQLKQSEDVPFGVSLVSDNTGLECPAQIIATKWLIASAQCVGNFSINSSHIKLSNASLPVNISRIVINPKYSKFRSLRVADYDIALIESSDAILITSDATTVCMPEHEIDPDITCFVGTADIGGDIPYEIVEKRVCNSSLHFNASLTARHFCANIKSNNQNSANNNNNNNNNNINNSNRNSNNCVPKGSPLICLSSTSRWYVAGFSSYQHGCNGSHFVAHPSIFSNIHNMRNFIDKVIGFKQYKVDTGDSLLYVEYSNETTELNPTTTTETPEGENSTVVTHEVEEAVTEVPQVNATVMLFIDNNVDNSTLSNITLIDSNLNISSSNNFIKSYLNLTELTPTTTVIPNLTDSLNYDELNFTNSSSYLSRDNITETLYPNTTFSVIETQFNASAFNVTFNVTDFNTTLSHDDNQAVTTEIPDLEETTEPEETDDTTEPPYGEDAGPSGSEDNAESEEPEETTESHEPENRESSDNPESSDAEDQESHETETETEPPESPDTEEKSEDHEESESEDQPETRESEDEDETHETEESPETPEGDNSTVVAHEEVEKVVTEVPQLNATLVLDTESQSNATANLTTPSSSN